MKSIIIDDEVFDRNSISVTQSSYSGEHTVAGISSSSFNYILNTLPEKSNYDKTNAKLSYITNSTNAYGEINRINVDYVGFKKRQEISKGVASKTTIQACGATS